MNATDRAIDPCPIDLERRTRRDFTPGFKAPTVELILSSAATPQSLRQRARRCLGQLPPERETAPQSPRTGSNRLSEYRDSGWVDPNPPFSRRFLRAEEGTRTPDLPLTRRQGRETRSRLVKGLPAESRLPPRVSPRVREGLKGVSCPPDSATLDEALAHQGWSARCGCEPSGHQQRCRPESSGIGLCTRNAESGPRPMLNRAHRNE